MSNICVSLTDELLWSKFHNKTNEMIINKDGRRMFPLLSFKIEGLEDKESYTIGINFEPVKKYSFKNGKWNDEKDEKFNKKLDHSTTLIHPDSPNTGLHWKKENVVFSKLRLTNKKDNETQYCVFLESLVKYQPLVFIWKNHTTDEHKFMFIETQFITVTSYRNHEITDLKIKNNRHAKAFLNNKSTIRKNTDFTADMFSSNYHPYFQSNFTPILPQTSAQSMPPNNYHSWPHNYPITAAAIVTKRPVCNIYDQQNHYNDQTDYSATNNDSYNPRCPTRECSYSLQPFESDYNSHHLPQTDFSDFSVATASDEQNVLKYKERKLDDMTTKRTMTPTPNFVAQLDTPLYSYSLENIDIDLLFDNSGFDN